MNTPPGKLLFILTPFSVVYEPSCTKWTLCHIYFVGAPACCNAEVLQVLLIWAGIVYSRRYAALVQVMAWRRTGDKPLPEPMMHIFCALVCYSHIIVDWSMWFCYPYSSGLLHWHCDKLMISPVPVMQPQWILAPLVDGYMIRIVVFKQHAFLWYGHILLHPSTLYTDIWPPVSTRFINIDQCS